MAERIGIRPCTILIKDNKVLCILQKSSNGEEFYLFPGGGIEKGETIMEAAIREAFEETGFKVEIHKLVYLDDYIKTVNKRCVNMVFLGEIIGGDLEDGEKDGGKVKRIEWIDLNKFKDIDFRPKTIAERLEKDYKGGFQEMVYF